MRDSPEESPFTGESVPCPDCGSSDALRPRRNGTGMCFATKADGSYCGNKAAIEGRERMDDDRPAPSKSGKPMIEGVVKALTGRKIPATTAQKYGYKIGNYNGRPCQIAEYRDPASRQLIGQHLRFEDKTFTQLGDTAAMAEMLWGEHLYQSGGPAVLVTEGQIDTMAADLAKNGKIAVVSLPSGTGSAVKSIQGAMRRGFFDRFKQVIIGMDMDEAGQAALRKILPLFKPGQAHILKLPMKDCGEMLEHGKGEALSMAIFNAQPYRPQEIVTVADVAAEAKKPITMGFPWCFDEMNDWDYGRRRGEITGFGAGTGVGKTTLLSQSIENDVYTLKAPTAAYMLESDPVALTRTIAGFHTGLDFSVPFGHRNCEYTQKQLDDAIDELEQQPNFTMFDSAGVCDWPSVKAAIRFNASMGIVLHYVDHLTALISSQAKETEELQEIMKEMAGLALELDIWIGYVSHLATPEGKSHEEGGHVSTRHFKGSRAIGFWSHVMYGLERNQQGESVDERTTTTIRNLKCRPNGRTVGETFQIQFDGKRLKVKGPSGPSAFVAGGRDMFDQGEPM